MRDAQSLETPTTAEHTANRQAEFRQLMGQFATGVCVVSTGSLAGGSEEARLAAMTVNSFVSVSLNPMLVSWNLQNSSSQFDRYLTADHFAVSILSAEQAELAQRYAARGDSQLRDDDFLSGDSGLPVIRGALAHIECRRWSHFAAGDHTLIFGEILTMSRSGTADAEGGTTEANLPLGFFNGKFCSISE